jgi:multidrug efflux pump subunit AcrA (membrane-fusion protein)
MKLLKFILVFLTLSVILVFPLGCGSSSTTTPATQVAKVQRGNLVTQITGVGNLAFSQTVDLPFEIDGTVSDILVVAGNTVQKGQVLARLDTSAWQDEVNTLTSQATTALRTLTSKKRAVTQAQQNLAIAQQALQTANNSIITKQLALLQAQINLQNAQLSLEQTEQTSTDPLQIQVKQLQVQLAQGQVNTAQLDLQNAQTFGMENAQAAVDDAATKLEDAITAVGDAQTALDQANQSLADAKSASPEVKAPFNGLITNVNVTGGQEIKKGTIAVTIADPTKFEATVMVSELNILKIKLGGLATVQIEALSGVSLPATVSFIAPSATISSSVVNYQVKVQLVPLSSISSNLTSFSNNTTGGSPGRFGQNSGSSNISQGQMSQIRQQMQSLSSIQLMQGLTVTVNIITAQANNVLMVPTQAIISQGGQTTIQVMVNGVAESRDVQTGISNSQYTEIISGLNEGDEVLVSLTNSNSGQSTRIPGGGFFFGR